MRVIFGVFIGIFFCNQLALSQAKKKVEDEKEFKFDCATCHECDTPTKSDPCLKPCPRFDLITVYHSPEEGPGVLNLDNFTESSDLYDPVIFTHRVHSEMSGMSGGCSMCHHYNPPGAVRACRDCHRIERLRSDLSRPDLKGAFHRQCIDCHLTWSHAIECESCHMGKDSGLKVPKEPAGRVHPRIEVPTKKIYQTEYDEGATVTFFHNEHVDLYGYTCQDCHTDENCARCHAKEKNNRAELGAHESHENCSNCHNTENGCSFCHSAKIKELFDHERRSGFALGRFHRELHCKNCHDNAPQFAGLDRHCNACHTDWNSASFDHRITGIILDDNHIDTDCADCHIKGIYTGQPSCAACHEEDISFPAQIPGRKISLEKR